MLRCLTFSSLLVTVPTFLFAQMATPPALNTALQTATVGSIVDLGFSSVSNTHLLNNFATRIPDAGDGLFYSDCPETVPSIGKLYEDTLPAGNNRIYLYHVNGLGAGNNLRISAALTNNGTTAATATITRKSFPAPSGNYSGIGREGVRQYYENAPLSIVRQISPGGSVLLDAALDSQVITNNQLVNVTYDVTFSAPLLVTSVAVPVGTDTLAALPAMVQSPNDAFLRQGTFSHNARENANPYTYKTSDGIKRLRFADAASVSASDPPLSGTDAESGTATTLRGNFAVTYKVSVSLRSDDNRRLAMLLNPRGGVYGGYFRTTFPEGSGTTVGGLVPSGTTSVPDSSHGGVVSLMTLTTASETLLLEFIPAGAMNLPFEILLVPYTVPPTPTASPTMSPSPTATATASPSPTVSLTPSPTASPTPNAQTSFTIY